MVPVNLPRGPWLAPFLSYVRPHESSGTALLRRVWSTPCGGMPSPWRRQRAVGRRRTRLEVSHARGFSKFVSRQSEMASLEAALEQAVWVSSGSQPTNLPVGK